MIEKYFELKTVLCFSTILFSMQLMSQDFDLSRHEARAGDTLLTRSVFWALGKCELIDFEPENKVQQLMDSHLDSLVSFLYRNPELGVHIVRQETNMVRQSMHPAQCRAEKLMNFLISRGINKERISIEGKTILLEEYGEDKEMFLLRKTVYRLFKYE